MKIVLAALNAKYVHSNLAVYDLEAYTKKKWREEKKVQCCFFGEDAEKKKDIFENGKKDRELLVKEYTINHNLDFILQDLYKEKASVYAFSCYIWNIYEILTITKELKKVLPKTRIWFGGPEVSYDGKNYLEKYPFVEGIILGEGEVTFYELTKRWQQIESRESKGAGTKEKSKTDIQKVIQSEAEYADIRGMIYRKKDGSLCETGKRPLMDLDDLPFVYYDLKRFQNKILYYETSRGCPYSCSYCLSSIDKKVRFRSFSIVQKELDFFLENKVPQVKFVDRTFNCNREHARNIWNYIAEHDNGVTNFHFEIAADLIGEEEFEIFQNMRPGLIQLEIGLQSTNPDTIKEIRRVMDVEKVKQTLLRIRSFKNIHQHLDLIAGLPFEDLKSFQKSFNDAYEMEPHQLQLGFLKVLKGSYIGEQIGNYDLKYRDVQPYEVLSTRWISYDEILILKKVEEMVEVYYNSGQFEYVLSYLVPFFDSPYDFYEFFGNYYEEKQLFGIGFKREARYTALREFCYEYFNPGEMGAASDGAAEHNVYKNGIFRECMDEKVKEGIKEEKIFFNILDDLLTFDFYLRENAKSRPSWIGEERISKSAYQTFFKNGGNAEISLLKEGYDSKSAAHMMHIEPLMAETVLILLRKELIRKEDMGKFLDIFDFMDKGKMVSCLFDYEHRDPLSKNAKVFFLSELVQDG